MARSQIDEAKWKAALLKSAKGTRIYQPEGKDGAKPWRLVGYGAGGTVSVGRDYADGTEEKDQPKDVETVPPGDLYETEAEAKAAAKENAGS